MNTLLTMFGICGAALLLLIGFAFLQTLLARLKVDSTIQLQCSSGDSEVMVINLNRLRGEGNDAVEVRMQESWDLIQSRRNFNHERWLKIQEESRLEKEEALKLAESVTALKKGPA